MPASGKTSLARTLAERLELPLVEKDQIKEELYDALGVGDVEWSRRLGGASYRLIVLVVRQLLQARISVIAEANFFRGSEALFDGLPPHRLVQVHCTAPLEVLVERYASRPARHEGHLDRQRVGELRARHASGANGPLDLAGELLVLDTTSASAADLAEQLEL